MGKISVRKKEKRYLYGIINRENMQFYQIGRFYHENVDLWTQRSEGLLP